ncbi:MAG: hypothetical protein JWO90_2139 [Solirubrobacterales bacterium]|nr:hypothetical protein [Solirubrobacterales bacterium]
MSLADAAGRLAVRLEREPAADLIPRFDGTTLRFTSKAFLDAPAGGGIVAGPVLLDLGEEGRLVGVTVLEERRFWQKGAIAWELPARATPHRLDVPAAPSRGPGGALASGAEVRWDASRKLCGVLFGEAEAPEVLALGPRAFAVVEDDGLVGLLADLRGFDRA